MNRSLPILLIALLAPVAGVCAERVLTTGASGHLLHNTQVFSPDDRWILFDRRNDETRLAECGEIAMVGVADGAERPVYRLDRVGPHGPGVGAATFAPDGFRALFIRGLDSASPASPYGAFRRCGFLVDLDRGREGIHLDARDVNPPLTAGALRGGTHAHHWSGDGRWVSFTYNDALVRPPGAGTAPDDLRTVGVMRVGNPVRVADPAAGEDFSGGAFAVVVVPVVPEPVPGSDQPSRAYEEGWVGDWGYARPDGSRQARALAFLGDVRGADGRRLTEVFLADLPEEIDRPGPGGPLEGGPATMPAPPAGVGIRRLTRPGNRPPGGVEGPRHWVRASPDGSTIAFLARDATGVVQIHGIAPTGGPARQISRLESGVETPIQWSPDGRHLACGAGGRIRWIDAATGASLALTGPSPPGCEPVHAVVVSRDGRRIAFNRRLPHSDGKRYLQICLVDVPDEGAAGP